MNTCVPSRRRPPHFPFKTKHIFMHDGDRALYTTRWRINYSISSPRGACVLPWCLLSCRVVMPPHACAMTLPVTVTSRFAQLAFYCSTNVTPEHMGHITDLPIPQLSQGVPHVRVLCVLPLVPTLHAVGPSALRAPTKPTHQQWMARYNAARCNAGSPYSTVPQRHYNGKCSRPSPGSPLWVG